MTTAAAPRTRARWLALVPAPAPEPSRGGLARCQLRRPGPRLAGWYRCAQRVPASDLVVVAGAARVVCARHRLQVHQLAQAGLLQQLGWTSPAARRLPRQPGPAQLRLFDPWGPA